MTSPMTSVMTQLKLWTKTSFAIVRARRGLTEWAEKPLKTFRQCHDLRWMRELGMDQGNEYSNMPIGHDGIGIGKLQAFFKPTEFYDSTIQVWGKLQTLNMPLHARSEQVFFSKTEMGLLVFYNIATKRGWARVEERQFQESICRHFYSIESSSPSMLL